MPVPIGEAWLILRTGGFRSADLETADSRMRGLRTAKLADVNCTSW